MKEIFLQYPLEVLRLKSFQIQGNHNKEWPGHNKEWPENDFKTRFLLHGRILNFSQKLVHQDGQGYHWSPCLK